jgi:hypothetical protein
MKDINTEYLSAAILDGPEEEPSRSKSRSMMRVQMFSTSGGSWYPEQAKMANCKCRSGN